MPHRTHLEITAPFRIGDIVAEVDLQGGGKTDVILREGLFEGDLPARAERLRLTLRDAPDGSALAPEQADVPAPQPPRGAPFEVDVLFGSGVEIPADGHLVAQVTWGMPCAAEQAPQEDKLEPTLFGAWEHMKTTEWIGRDQLGKPLSFNHLRADFSTETPLAVGNKNLRFPEIVALAGDYYAHLDEKARNTPAIAAMWPPIGGVLGWLAGDYRETTLTGESAEAAAHLLQTIYRDKDKPLTTAENISSTGGDTLFRDFPLRRFGALASQNFCHFASQPWDGTVDDARNHGLQMYRLYHERALAEARKAGAAKDGPALLQSLVVEGFACHFLTDLCASGHIRVPRRELTAKLGIVKGGAAAGAAHNEDNKGLWVRMRMNPPNRKRYVWRAVGDNFLLTTAGAQHLAMVREAVRRSVEEVFATFAGVTPRVKGEDLLPVPLPPGQGPSGTDLAPDAVILGVIRAAGMWPRGAQVNSYPLYALSRDGALGKRIGAGPGYEHVGAKGGFELGKPS